MKDSNFLLFFVEVAGNIENIHIIKILSFNRIKFDNISTVTYFYPNILKSCIL
jgi:hypothetical protein